MSSRSPSSSVLPFERNVWRERAKRGDVVHRLVLAGLALVPAAAIFDLFGQRPTTSRARSEAATLSVHSPTRLRGGLRFTTRFDVHANRSLRDAILVLDSGWFEGMQVNGMTPTPRSEASADGAVRLVLGRIARNDDVLLFVRFRVKPTSVGRRSQDVRLLDGSTQLVDLQRTVTVLP